MHRSFRFYGWAAALAVAVILLVAGGGKALAQEPVRADRDELAAKIAATGNVPLIVGLRVPGYSDQDVGAAVAQEAAIAQAGNAVLLGLAGYNVENVKSYTVLPYLALTVDSVEALDALYADPNVVSIVEDGTDTPALEDSVPLIEGHFAHILFYNGQGQAVVVMDTGVQKTHPDLAGKVVAEACFSTNNAGQGASSLCPGGATSSTANNSGLNCATNISGCDHGTHVAGIVAGVAPGADLVAIQVFSRITDNGTTVTSCSNAGRTSPCTLSYVSDQLSALNYVLNTLRNQRTIASINMSLGGGQFTAACDNDTRKSAVDLLRGAGIATVISAGNSGFRNAMGAPGCISAAVSVAATTKSDQVASYSNVASFTDLYAPGSDIYAPIPINNNDDKSGTSMAAPHVAGAVAVLKQANPSLTGAQIENLLVSNGPLITDQRSGGSITKRRLQVYHALCDIITCDADDYRTMSLNQTLNGAITPSTDRDHYFINVTAGQRVTIQMNRTSGSVDPYLELFDPVGNRVALNNNGGAGSNALINNYTLQQTGRYLIVARSSSSTGGYSLQTSQQAVPLNPVPVITRLTPSSATGSFIASDFWVRIDGRNFMPDSWVYWNGSLRMFFYSSSTRVWIRVRGSDLAFPWPRDATIRVRNPDPGGGYSNSRTFDITFPFLGTSELVQPSAISTVTTGISTTLVISWTAPMTITSWRNMQNMDLRLRDDQGQVAAWIRVVERPGISSTYRLLNAAEVTVNISDTVGTPDEGLPGENRNLVISDTVTLHLADSAFAGSERTAIMSPTVTFGPNAVGTYHVEFRVDGPDGEVQDDDILGQMTIVPASCPYPVTGATVTGPSTGQVNVGHIYMAQVQPPNATVPVTYTWSPEPLGGQGTSTAVYNWPNAGERVVAVGVENCEGFAAAQQVTKIYTTNAPDLGITKVGPATAIPGQPITYTLIISNSGAQTATNVIVVDVLPPGANYVSGGTLIGGQVNWSIPQLAGYGAVTETTLVVTATTDITNSNYSVGSAASASAAAAAAVSTQLVDAQVAATSVTSNVVSHNAGSQKSTTVALPEGAVADDTTIVYKELSGPSHPLSPTVGYAGRAFKIEAYQNNVLVPGFKLGETIPMSVGYAVGDLTGLLEGALKLYAWDGSQYSDAGISCSVNAGAGKVGCSADNPVTGEFVLAAACQTASVALVASPQTQMAKPGTKVSYTVQVSNTGNGPDSFAVEVSSPWLATATPTETTSLQPNTPASITVEVTVPGDAKDGDKNSTTVTLRSRLDGAVAQAVTLVTEAMNGLQEVYLPYVQK